MNQQNTYEQHHEYAQQAYPSGNVPLPNNFLETDEPQQDQVLQQRIISGEYAPEPSEYSIVANDYGNGGNTYDPYGQGNISHHQYHQYHQQMPSSYEQQQYAQIEDPWLDVQHDSNVYVQEIFDPSSMNDQYIYQNDQQQPTSSQQQQMINNNPFEEEEDEEYEPMPVTVRIQPMRRIGQPPRQMARPNVEEYDPEQQQRVIHRPGNNNSSPPGQQAKAPERKLRYARKIQPAPRRDSYEDYFINRDGTQKARIQAAKRIATPEGWNSLNQWFKKANESDDRDRLIHLLETCKEAEISADLLRINDTGKIVKEIARKHPNANINRLSNEVLEMWKAVVIADTKSSKKKAAKKVEPKPEKVETPKETKTKEAAKEQPKTSTYSADENLLDKITSAMEKQKDEPSTSVTAPSTTPSEKKPRVKAKVKLSSSRRTGLEGDDDDTTTTAPPAKKDKPTLKKKSDQPTMVPPKPTPAPKRVLQSSDMFLAAFDDADKKPTTKKLKVNKVVKVVQPDVPTTNETVPTSNIKSEWEIKPEQQKSAASKPPPTNETIDQIPLIPREKGGGILRRAALTAEEKSLRKIRFYDQFDKPLVAIQYFEIEEGERINVNRHFNHDSIKLWEMQDEGKQLKMHQNDEEDAETSPKQAMEVDPTASPSGLGRKDSMPPLPLSGITPQTVANASDWNLIGLELPESQFVRGFNSTLHEASADRERNSMAAFIDPNTATDVTNEDDPELDAVATEAHTQSFPIRIPLTLQTNGDSQEKIVEPEPAFNQPSELPLPFSSTINSSPQVNASPTDAPIYQTAAMSPPIVSSEPPQANKVDAFMELLKQQAAAQADLINNDKDLRQEVVGDLDQDFRQEQNKEEYSTLDTPLSPPPEQDTLPPTTEASKPALTLETFSTLAELAGKSSGSLGTSLGSLGGLNLADILSKVELAQSETVVPQQHQYAQEDINEDVAPSIITQVHGEFFQHPNKYNATHQYHQKGMGVPETTRFPTPGIRPTSTNPRGGYFQTPTNMSRFRTVPCKYFLAGTCNFGEACRFLHTTPDGQIVPHKPIVTQPPQQQFPTPSVDTAEVPAPETSSSFQLALSSSKSSSQSIEAAANYLQRGNYRGRRGYRGDRGGSGYRRDYDDRRSRRSPRRYDDRRRHSPRRSRRRSNSNDSGRSSPDYDSKRRRHRSSSDSSNEGQSRKRDRRNRSRSRSPPARNRSPSPPHNPNRSRSPSYDENKTREKSPPKKEDSKERSRSPSRGSSRRSSRHDSL